MSGRLRARAARLMRQLDAGAGYRREIEQEIAKRIGEAPAGSTKQDPAYASRSKEQDPPYAVGACASCGTNNDSDARFCKHCGATMERRA
jgi:hypothetical protein